MTQLNTTSNNTSTSTATKPATQANCDGDVAIDSATATDTPQCLLNQYFDFILQPNDDTIVCGALDKDKVKALAEAGVQHVINLQPEDELTFDEAAAVNEYGMTYSHLPISGADDLKQVNLLAFDRILREQHGKKIAMHCKSGNRVGAVVALRQGWLRGRKMDTAMARGKAHGLTGLEQEVHNRLLVPR